MAEVVPRKMDEGTTTCLVGHDVEAMPVAEEVDKKTKKVKGANTLRRKKNKTKKELAEGETHGVEPKKGQEETQKSEARSDVKNEGNNEGEVNTTSEGETKSEAGTEESCSVPSYEPTPAQPTPSISPRPPTESEGHQQGGGDDHAKNESEETAAEKKTKTKKKGKKKAKKGGDDTPSLPASSLLSLNVDTAAVNGGPASPRTAAEAQQEEKKKKKKKKKPKTPRGGGGAAVVAPLKIEESEAKKSEGKSEEPLSPVTHPPLSAVRAGPTVRLTSSSSSVVTPNAPPSPSVGVKFAQRLSLANVIPKLSSLPFEKKPRTFNSNIYNQSFSGKTLVKWMLEAGTGVKMDLEAMILGELMLNAGVIVPLSRKVEFSASGKDFYALTEGYVDFARPRMASVGGSMMLGGGGSMIGGRPATSEDLRRVSRRSSVMLTFRSLSVRGLNHMLASSKDKEKKEDEAGGGGGGSDQNLVYGKSLEEVLALQKESHPDEKVPIILKTLTKAIIDTNGHKTEGIFRVPGKNDEIFRLKAQFNKTDYSITSDDPNDLGGCLKMWFRELKDPLIPNNIYDDCVLVANNPAECLEMVSTRVPELNKTVIYFLLGFLQEMSRHAGVTRMGSANLGMVFAPGLLRCEDVMKMMTNTAHEGAFVKNLIEHYRPAPEN